MELQLSFFLVIYLIYILVYLFFTFFNFYHILKHGFASFNAYLITFVYLAITAVTLIISYYYLNQIDWSYPVLFFETTESLF